VIAMPKAVVLLSGGLDSTVTLAYALNNGDDVTALSFRYGQRHSKELDSAKAVAEYYKLAHVTVDVDMSSFGSSLIGNSKKIEKDRTDIGSDIPDTYVPARNMIMLSIATGLCETVGAEKIYIGANSVDYSGYPDCRMEFFDAFERSIEKGTKKGSEGHPIKISVPIIEMTKAEIVKLGKELNAPLHLTWSCYEGGDEPCGHCDSCILRKKGFEDAGYKDEAVSR
jgi:7-cyano-7-deazaguanine synthase